MANETPMQTVKKLYGSKDKLISSIVGTVKLEGESDADTVARLKSVSNEKLLRMSAVAKKIADRGGREIRALRARIAVGHAGRQSASGLLRGVS